VTQTHAQTRPDESSASAQGKSLSPALQRAHAAQAAKRAAGELVRLDPIARAAANPTSLRAAITAKCWDCMGGDADPGTRQRIRECECPRCPLHHVRPYQRREGAR
jgi:hypothetical protein